MISMKAIKKMRTSLPPRGRGPAYPNEATRRIHCSEEQS